MSAVELQCKGRTGNLGLLLQVEGLRQGKWMGG